MNYNYIKNYLIKRKAIIIITIIFVLFMIIVLPLINWLNINYIGEMASPDTMLFYSAEKFYLLMDNYGSSGRNLYIILRWTFDFIYPLVYGVFLLSWLLFLMDKLNKIYKWMIYLVMFAVTMDYLENIFASINVGIYPKEIPLLVYIMQVSSFLKWLSLIFIIINILVLSFIFIKKSKFSKNIN